MDEVNSGFPEQPEMTDIFGKEGDGGDDDDYGDEEEEGGDDEEEEEEDEPEMYDVEDIRRM